MWKKISWNLHKNFAQFNYWLSWSVEKQRRELNHVENDHKLLLHRAIGVKRTTAQKHSTAFIKRSIRIEFEAFDRFWFCCEIFVRLFVNLCCEANKYWTSRQNSVDNRILSFPIQSFNLPQLRAPQPKRVPRAQASFSHINHFQLNERLINSLPLFSLQMMKILTFTVCWRLTIYLTVRLAPTANTFISNHRINIQKNCRKLACIQLFIS